MPEQKETRFMTTLELRELEETRLEELTDKEAIAELRAEVESLNGQINRVMSDLNRTGLIKYYV